MAGNKFYAPPLSVFGYGSIKSISEELVERKYKKALVVTDKVMCDLGIINRVTEVLEASNTNYVVFNEVKSNPTTKNVDEGVKIFKDSECDFIITLGGGSPQDCGKAISILVGNGGKVQDYIGMNMSKKKGPDLIAINTTAGTGSESTRAYVITDEATQSKFGIRDNHAQASIAINDWEVMMGLPKAITAGTGMDALTHAVECLVSKKTFLLTTELALSAIKLIFKHLETAVKMPNNREARGGMATAQYLAGLAFGNGGVGLVHSMSHQLSAVYDLPHGLSNALLLADVMEFNKNHCLDQLAEMGQVIFPLLSKNKTKEEQADIAINKIRELSACVETNVSLSSLGVKEEDFELLAEKTLKDGSINNNPIMPTAEEIIELYKKVY